MASNLRVEFYERQRKHLSESITINPSPSKKAYLKPIPNPPSKSAPPTTIVAVTLKSDEKPSFIDDISYHETRKPFIIPREINKDSFECLNSSPLRPNATYLLVPNMGVLFSTMQRIPVKVDENSIQSFMAWLSCGTPNVTIAYIFHAKDYIAFEIVKVVLLVTFLIFPLVSRLIMISVAPKW
ncbi:hypothetical protein PVL29_016086 [Vitis rotundifolia]|uniref:Uncharacterized protein n=1 Tax=Vitis rotundifolia TaxID=103349 RepID=A0AA38ZEP4_VITRO|nr:hypothetical protein PVL29_016086 [Vitis rotundifolia]